jgi:hypothetical protein
MHLAPFIAAGLLLIVTGLLILIDVKERKEK